MNRKIVTSSSAKAQRHGTPRDATIWCPRAQCAKCDGKTFRKETDILDVWFDSGVSWLAVCESDPDLSAIYKGFQNESGTKVLYLEGATSTAAGSILPCSPRWLYVAARLIPT